MKAVFLTGFMGAGKTTIGEELAEKLGLPVMDTDHYIVSNVGKSIPDIFQENGEQQFRQYEREFLKQLPTRDVVITTGGGLVIQEENRKWMKENGVVIFLYCQIEEVFNRVKADGSRPLLNLDEKEKAISLFKSRLSFYQEAHYTIDTTNLSIDEVVAEIDNLLKNYQFGNNE